MNGILGKQEHLKSMKFSSSERSELLRLSEENNLGKVYEYIITRMNEYEMSVLDGQFYCGMLEQTMTLNHIACLLKQDCVSNSPVAITSGLACKLSKLFLKALIECCVADGVVELDASDVLRRSVALSHRVGNRI